MMSIATAHNYSNPVIHVWPSFVQATVGSSTSVSSSSVGDSSYVVTLSGYLAGVYHLVKPVSVTVIRDEEGAYIASDSITTVYGYGNNDQEAMSDYVTSLIDYYELIEMSDNCSAGDVLRFLNQYITKVR